MRKCVLAPVDKSPPGSIALEASYHVETRAIAAFTAVAADLFFNFTFPGFSGRAVVSINIVLCPTR